MQSLRRTIANAIAGGLAAASCVPPPSQPADFIPRDSVGFQECSAGTASRTVVRVLVPADLSTIGARRVRYKVYPSASLAPTDDVAEYDDPTAKANDGATPEFKANRYHINLNTIDRSGGDAFVKVRVVLLNPQMEFFSVPRADPARDIQGVALPDGAPQAIWFCQTDADAITRPKQYSVVTFYIRRYQQGAPALGDASINLFMRAKDTNGRQTPIILDPRIKNNG